MTMKRVAVIALLIASSAALSQEPRKIDFTTVLLDADGNPYQECVLDSIDCKEKRNITLGLAAMRALSQPEKDLPSEESLKRGQLAISVYKSTGATLTVEELSLIKKQIAKMYNPIVIVRAFAILDPASK